MYIEDFKEYSKELSQLGYTDVLESLTFREGGLLYCSCLLQRQVNELKLRLDTLEQKIEVERGQ